MTELINKANSYAAEKTNFVMEKAVAQAYADGYRDGYKDREEEIPVDIRDGNTEYVDLELESGTLWAKEYEIRNNNLDYESFNEALKYNLPTKAQCEELFNSCRFKQEDNVIYCIGPNGRSIIFSYTGYKEIGKEELPAVNWISYFWIKNEDKESDHNAASLGNSRGIWKNTTQLFPGYKLPIRLVKKK